MYNKIFFYIFAFVHFIITLFYDNYLFIPEDYYKNPIYISTKVISLIIIFYIWHKLCDILNDLKKNNKTTKIFVTFFSIHFILNIIFCILTLPSIYTQDAKTLIYEITNLECFVSMSLNSWFPTIFYMMSFEIIPSDFAHVLMTEIITSLLVGNIMKILSSMFSIKYLSLIFLLFLFPTFFLVNAFPFRSVMFTYCFLLLSIVFFKKYTIREKFLLKELIFYAVFAALITIIRSDSLIFAITIPVSFILIFIKEIPIKKIFCFCLIYYFALTVFLIPIVEHKGKVKNYGLNVIMTNFDYIIMENENNWSEIIAIQNQQEKDMILHKSDINITHFKNIIINNWKLLIKRRILMFQKIINLTPSYDSEHWDGYYSDTKFYFPKTSKKLLNFYDSPFLYKIRYNVLIPLVLLILVLGKGLQEKNRFCIYWTISILLYFTLLFFLVPHSIFIYMSSIFISGLILPVCQFLYKVRNI